jgi:hypothetical protein
MKTLSLSVALAMTVAMPGSAASAKPGQAPAKAQAAKDQKPQKRVEAKSWGQLIPKLGKWAQQRVMAVGWLSKAVEKAGKLHGAFSRQLFRALTTLNRSRGPAGACWPNLRLALARLTMGAVKGAKTKLADVMRPVISAFEQAPRKVGKGGMKALVRAMNGVKGKLKNAAPPFKRSLFGAIVWLRRPCNLWENTKGGTVKPPPPKPVPKFKPPKAAPMPKVAPPAKVPAKKST